jgi:hypothetical protein
MTQRPVLTEAQRLKILKGPCTRALMAHSRDLAEGMQGLCDAVGKLSRVRDALQPECHLDPAEVAMRAKLARGCEHLVHAVAAMPNEAWACMLDDAGVSAEDLQDRLLSDGG